MSNSVFERIEQDLKAHDVVLYMKGTPDFPQCGFSAAVVEILNIFEVDFVGINVLQDQSLREGIKEYTQWPTIPQLYVKGQFIGGCDIVREMAQDGELAKLFQENGIKSRVS